MSKYISQMIPCTSWRNTGFFFFWFFFGL